MRARRPSAPRSTSRRLVGVVAVVLATALVAAGCSGDDAGGGSIGDVTVSENVGKTPTVEIPDDFSVDETQVEVVVKGDGPVLEDGDDALVHVDAYDGRTGESFTSSFASGQPGDFVVGEDNGLLPGIVDAIAGQTVGSRLLIAMTPEDGFGAAGNPTSGIQPDDSIVAVIDLMPRPPKPKATGTIADVTVTGAYGEKPTVTFPEPFYVDRTQSKVLVQGDGEVVRSGDTVQVDYIGLIGRTGEVFQSSYGAETQPESLPLLPKRLISGFLQGLVGKRLGDRVLITIPRDAGYGQTGNGQLGINGSDTIVFVVDLVEPAPQPAANGDVGDVKVTGEPGAAPVVSVQTPLYVDETQTRVLRPGTGPVLADGDSVRVDYVAVDLRTGEQFDSSFAGPDPAPAVFALTSGSVIDGFRTGLVGQRVGSRVLIVMPRDDGYGAAGNSGAGIGPKDSLAFVVDVLARPSTPTPSDGPTATPSADPSASATPSGG